MRRIQAGRLLVAALLCAAVANASGNTLYVSSDTGSDDAAATGSASAPYATLSYALGKAAEGDVLRLRGLFAGDATLTKGVTITSDIGRATIRGSLLLSGAAVDGLVLQNLDFYPAAGPSIVATNVQLENLLVTGCNFNLNGALAIDAVVSLTNVKTLDVGMTFKDTIFQVLSAGSTSDGTFVIIKTLDESTGPIKFESCNVIGNSPSEASANAAARVSVTTKGPVSVTMTNTLTGGVFELYASEVSLLDNVFSGLGVVVAPSSEMAVDVKRNTFTNIGSYSYGRPNDVAGLFGPVSLSIAPVAALDPPGTVNIMHNTFSSLIFTERKNYGAIQFASIMDFSDDVAIVKGNDFSNVAHTEYAIRYEATDVQLLSLENYWGDTTGPYSPVCNPSGRGPRVSDNTVSATKYCYDSSCSAYLQGADCDGATKTVGISAWQAAVSVLVTLVLAIVLVLIVYVVMRIVAKKRHSKYEADEKAEDEEVYPAVAASKVVRRYKIETAPHVIVEPSTGGSEVRSAGEPAKPPRVEPVAPQAAANVPVEAAPAAVGLASSSRSGDSGTSFEGESSGASGSSASGSDGSRSSGGAHRALAMHGKHVKDGSEEPEGDPNRGSSASTVTATSSQSGSTRSDYTGQHSVSVDGAAQSGRSSSSASGSSKSASSSKSAAKSGAQSGSSNHSGSQQSGSSSSEKSSSSSEGQQ